MASISKVVIFDQVLYKRGHLVHRWMTQLAFRFGEHARRYAPVRTGVLREGIHSSTQQVGTRQVEGTIASEAPYTMFVLRGTGTPGKGRAGYIYATRAYANPSGAYSELWGSVVNGKFTTRRVKGVERKQYTIKNKGYFMSVPKTKGGALRGPRFRVHGQEPNNFLDAAWRATARQHRAIRGKVPAWIADL